MSAETHLNEIPVSWQVDEIDVSATLARPAGEGPFPAVLFVAGSGPTDRNWNSPMLPGTNGSAALLARVLTESGFITLRYDKRGSGPQVAENMKRMVGKISMQGHVQEVAGGVELLAARPDVDPARIFVLTNSEGCVHAINYQVQGKGLPFAGLVLTSAFARATGDVARSQIAAQFAAVPGGDAIMAAYDAAMADFSAGRPVQVDESLPAPLQQVVLAITQPANQPFARELWVFDPSAHLGKVSVPVLIVLGKKDIQVDWQVDGAILPGGRKRT